MSNFTCEECKTPIIDSASGYVSGCEHYPPDITPTRGFGAVFSCRSGIGRRWAIDEFGTKRWADNNQICKSAQ